MLRVVDDEHYKKFSVLSFILPYRSSGITGSETGKQVKELVGLSTVYADLLCIVDRWSEVFPVLYTDTTVYNIR